MQLLSEAPYGLRNRSFSPPLSISAETFTVVADFCYGADIALTPLNVVFLRVAAELLEMTEDDGDGGGNLVERDRRRDWPAPAEGLPRRRSLLPR